MAPPPAGDRVVDHTAAAGSRMITEYVPRGQTVQNWGQMVTVQIIRRDPPPAGAFLERMKAITERGRPCDQVEFQLLQDRGEAGRRSARAMLICPRRKGAPKGEAAIIQALTGRDALYVVQRAARGPAYLERPTPPWPQAELEEWARYLERISVRDSRDPRRPCITPATR